MRRGEARREERRKRGDWRDGLVNKVLAIQTGRPELDAPEVIPGTGDGEREGCLGFVVGQSSPKSVSSSFSERPCLQN